MRSNQLARLYSNHQSEGPALELSRSPRPPCCTILHQQKMSTISNRTNGSEDSYNSEEDDSIIALLASSLQANLIVRAARRVPQQFCTEWMMETCQCSSVS